MVVDAVAFFDCDVRAAAFDSRQCKSDCFCSEDRDLEASGTCLLGCCCRTTLTLLLKDGIDDAV